MVKLKLKLLLGTCYLQAPMDFELGLSFASVLFLLFLGVAGWVLKLKLMLTQPKLKLKLRLSLAISHMSPTLIHCKKRFLFTFHGLLCKSVNL